MKSGLVLPLIAAVACATASQEIEQARLAAQGQTPRQLRACLGLPDHEQRYEAAVFWLYVEPLILASGRKDIEIHAQIEGGQPTGRVSPTIVEGDVQKQRLPSGPGNPTVQHKIPPGACAAQFELREGRVVDLDVRGRTPANLNADAECARQFWRCLSD